MSELAQEIAVYDSLREKLEVEQPGKWVLVQGADVAGFFESFDAAATFAVSKFGRGPYLIRQVGAAPIIIPASAMFIFQNA